jgi:hypothetical protein
MPIRKMPRRMGRQIAAADHQIGQQVADAVTGDYAAIDAETAGGGAADAEVQDRQRHGQEEHRIPGAVQDAGYRQDVAQQFLPPRCAEAARRTFPNTLANPRYGHARRPQGRYRQGRQAETQRIEREKMHRRDQRAERRDHTRAKQPRQPVRCIQQGIGRHQQPRFGDQRRQQGLQRRREECLRHRQNDHRGAQQQGRGLALRQPCGGQQRQHRRAHQIGRDHGALPVPSVGQAAAESGRQQRHRRSRRAEIAGRRPERTYRHPAQRHRIKLVSKRRKSQRGPDAGNGSMAERQQDAHGGDRIAFPAR